MKVNILAFIAIALFILVLLLFYSVVLGHPFPCDVLSLLEIEKFKLEDEMVRVLFIGCCE